MRKDKRGIFITGATGFLASNLLKVLLDEGEEPIYVLIRADNDSGAAQRKKVLLKKLFPGVKSRRKAALKIRVVRGDITKNRMGLSKNSFKKLQNGISMIYHCAAISDFSYELAAIRKANVKGTENLLRSALNWQKNGCLENVNHISTVYIAGNYSGTFYEQDRYKGQDFNNTYEQSKFEAELVVEKYRKMGLPIDIYRPSIVTDSSFSGVNSAKGVLWLLELGMLGIFKTIPADADKALNMIPVDAASRAIYLISKTKDRPVNGNYHIVNPLPVRLGSLLNDASKFLGFKKPRCIRAEKFDISRLTLIQRKMIERFIPYLNQNLSFDMSNAASLLRKHGFKIQRIDKRGLKKVLERYRATSPVIRRKNYAVKK